jgi:hypothetical protein
MSSSQGLIGGSWFDACPIVWDQFFKMKQAMLLRLSARQAAGFLHDADRCPAAAVQQPLSASQDDPTGPAER